MTVDQNRCSKCGEIRPRYKQWFYAYPDIHEPGRALAPINVWCPGCAPPEVVAERKERCARNLARLRKP